MKQKITIIGATDGFGKWLVSFILKDFRNEADIKITGRNIEKGEKVAKDIGCYFSDNNIESVKDADIVIFSVPIAYMESTIREVAPYIKQGALAIDICSIKSVPAKALKESCKPGVMVLPLHPMFGPFVSSIAGQMFVLTSEIEVKTDKRYKFLVDYLNNAGAKVIETSPLEHDKMMAVVQGLTHFDMFVLAETIKRLGLDIEKSMDFVSPIYKIMISSVARYVGQNPKLYGDIQMYNDEVLAVHKVFMEVTNDFNRFIKNKDEESFVNTILETKKYFGKHSEQGQKYTDKIIYMIGKQIEKAEKSIGKQIEIINIYTKEKINGKLEKYDDNKVYLEGNKVYILDEWEII